MSSFRKLIAIAMLAMAWQGCSCDPLISPPDGGAGGGGRAGGSGTAGGTGTGGGMAGGNTAGGAAGGNTAGGMAGGSTAGGSAGGAAGGAAGGMATQLTEYVRNLIVTGTSGTAQPRPESEYAALPDNAPITFSPAFFDGGTN